ncbi:MAG TPA: hypothetical protein VN541_19650 [Tepidisphaeraceae bacterium]|nr:hypothetical protein [Tepidisphaeraceae bacterium]
MTISNYTLRPSLRAALLTFLVHHNPFYLLSALSMLAGCYALNSGLAPRAGDLSKVLALIVVLNVYELILIALGLYLLCRRGILRDGRTLLLLEAPFLVDLAFLVAQAGSVSARVGLAINLVVLALAVLKAGVVLRVLWGSIPRSLFFLIAIELSALFLMPSAFTAVEHNGYVSAGQFYASWWVVGLLIAATDRLAWRGAEADRTGLQRLIRGLYVFLPLASMIAHLSMLHWVYRSEFVAGDLSPVLLGCAIVLGRARRVKDVTLARVMCVLAAVVLSAQFPPAVQLHLTPRLDLTPFVATLGGAYLTLVFGFFARHALRLLAAAALGLLVGFFGPTVQQIVSAAVWMADRATDLLQKLMPHNAIEWGLLAVGSSFAFLALGAAVSLRKEPPVQAQPHIDVPT